MWKSQNISIFHLVVPDKFVVLHFQSRDRLLRALRSMNAGEAGDQVIRQVDKMLKNNERASRDARLGKVFAPSLTTLCCLSHIELNIAYV